MKFSSTAVVSILVSLSICNKVINAFSSPSLKVSSTTRFSPSQKLSSISRVSRETILYDTTTVLEEETKEDESPTSSTTNNKEEKSLTQRIMESTTKESQATGAGGFSTYDAFLKADTMWSKLKSSKPFDYDITNLSQVQNGIEPPVQFVTDDGAIGNPAAWSKLRESQSKKLDYDITLCGGTLGIFIALSLQLKGHKVLVVEAGKLMGREQEWNISMKELEELVELGVLSQSDVEEAIKTEFPGCRAGFKNSEGEFI